MLKEITLKMAVKPKRKDLYDLIYDYIDMNYQFSNIEDYHWFVKNIAKKNELTDILEYNYLEIDGELFRKVNINVVYNFANTLIIHEIELIIPKEIDIPEFKSGENE